MNPTPAAQPPAPRRHIWRWVLLGAGLCLAPFVLLGIVAASFLTLNRDAAVLRKHVMAATDAGWHTKIQLSVGGVTLGAVRTGMIFAHGENMEDARLALAAVRHASVGVYERSGRSPEWSRQQLFADTDRAMARRGWTRLVGVADHKDTVLVYVSDNANPDRPIDLCVAVVNEKELVVVSTSLNTDKVVELAARHTPEDVKRQLKLAKLGF